MKEKTKRLNKKLLFSIAISLIIVLITSFLIYGILTANKEYFRDEKRILIPIFVYHNLIEGEQEDVALDYMETTTKRFEEQLQGLIKFGYNIIDYEDLIAFSKGEKKLPKKVALITFDDGNENNYTLLYPIAKKYNIPIAINIIDDAVGEEGRLTWDQIKEMKESGLVTICSHSKDHAEINNQEISIFMENTKIAFENITKKTGQERKIFTYPYGLYREENIEILEKEGVIQNLTDNKINNSKDLDLSRLHRCYPLNDSIYKMFVKLYYRDIRYGGK